MVKSVLITGCSDNGLGAALAIAFQKTGNYKVIASARNLKKLGQVTAAGCDTIQLDVTDAESVKACAAEVSTRLGGKLDVLVNNAGGMCALPITDLDLKDVRDIFELNVFSIIAMTQAFFPLIRAAQGMIVNQTSCAAVVALPMQSAYNATKSAASAFTVALRLEMEPFNIKVVELRTGAVKSSIFENTREGSTTLPENSPYASGKDIFNPKLGGAEIMKTTETADVYARQVVADLSKANPSYRIYRGQSATLVKWTSWLPIWLFDSTVKKMMGIDVFTKRLAASNSAVKA